MDIVGLQTFRVGNENECGQLVFHRSNELYYVEHRRNMRVQIRSALTIDEERSAMRLDKGSVKTVLSEDMNKIIQFITTNEISKYVKIIHGSVVSNEESVADSPFQSKDACSFLDKDNSFISFEVDQKGCLRMTCDDNKVGDPIVGVQRIMIDEIKGEIFDGEEIVPVRITKIIISTQRSNDPSNRKTLYKQVLRKDRKRVFSWFRDIKDRLSTCEIDDANCCEFKDEEGTAVKFVRCKNRVQEWCDGVTIIDKIERMTVDRDGGVILDQDDELIPISIADRDRVFGWIDRVFKELNVDMGYAKLVERDGSDVDLTNIVSQKRKSPGRFVISANRKKPTRRALIKGKDKEEEKKKKRVRSHGDDASAKRKKKKKKKSTLPSFSTSNPKHLVGYVFQEIESEELFAILESLGERTLRYASLTPDPQEDENTFECTINKNALLMDRVRIVREATSEEMKKAIALWKREHPPQKKSGLLCSLFTDESLNANIEIEVEDGRMDIFRDRMIAVENVTNLIVNEKYVELLFERKALESQFHSHPLSSQGKKNTHTQNALNLSTTAGTAQSCLSRRIRIRRSSQRFVRAIVSVSSSVFVNMQLYRL